MHKTKRMKGKEKKPPVESRCTKTMNKDNRRAFSLHNIVNFMIPPLPIIVPFWFVC
jgi:hypothetical protein